MDPPSRQADEGGESACYAHLVDDEGNLHEPALGQPAQHASRRVLVFSPQDRVMAGMLIFVVAAIVASRVGAPAAVQFFLSVIAIIPLAGFIGSATEHLADRAGGRIGGLLNATFGNSPDLLIGIFGVQKGLIPLVKATLVGALISNSALIMGICYVVAGLKYRAPEFRRAEAGNHSVLMLLTVAAILFPSLGSFVMCGDHACASATNAGTILHLSVGIAIALMFAYVAYVAFSIFGLQSFRAKTQVVPGPEEEIDTLERAVVRERGSDKAPWPTWFGVAVLAGATLLVIPTTDILTSSVEPVTKVLGWSQVFVGMIIVANAGNVAEGYAAIRLAFARAGTRAQLADTGQRDTGLDLALGIASASSIQIATFVAPLIVLYSLFTHPMNLVFSAIEIGILGILVLLFAHVVHDGESNWLEGVELLALYAMAGVIFFMLPASAFGG